MADALVEAVAGQPAWLVGGCVRDELLGRPVLDLDVTLADPERAARRYGRLAGEAVFPLSERHGAWRVVRGDGVTVDFVRLRGSLAEDLAARDFTLNAIAVPVDGGDHVDPTGGLADLERRVLRAVSDGVFRDDPLRLLRAVRIAEELGLAIDGATEALIRRDAALVTRPAGERVLAELERLRPSGWRRLDALGLLEPLGGDLARLDRVAGAPGPALWLVACLGQALLALPVPGELARLARTALRATPPPDAGPRAIHRFRRAAEPWAVEALLLAGRPELIPAVEAARAAEPAGPLLRGDELGVPPGPEVGRLLDRVAEERAAGTISTREEALALVRKERS
ncbi:MAG: hypothetical protein R3C15_03500 [Thermoleophilia bacterium]